MKAFLLTGRPGIGKTTVVRRVAEALHGERIAGFYTEEQQSRGSRTGFRIATLDGRSRPMAGIDIRSAQRVGKYGIDVAAIDTVAETALAPEAAEIFLVDEISKMECASSRSGARAARCRLGGGGERGAQGRRTDRRDEAPAWNCSAGGDCAEPRPSARGSDRLGARLPRALERKQG